jgi:hypothetical protein
MRRSPGSAAAHPSARLSAWEELRDLDDIQAVIAVLMQLFIGEHLTRDQMRGAFKLQPCHGTQHVSLFMARLGETVVRVAWS